MHVLNRRAWGLALVAALVLSLAAPSYAAARGVLAPRSASGFRALVGEPDADGNGTPAAPITGATSPATGALDLSSDWDDLYEIDATEGDIIAVSLDSSATLEGGLYVFGPGTTDLYADAPLGSDIDTVLPQVVTVVAPTTGKYYLDAACLNGTGNYTISWEVTEADTDDTLPGELAVASPILGEVDVFGDVDDIFYVPMTQGETLRVWLVGEDDLDADLALFDSTASNVATDEPLISSVKDGTDEFFEFTAPATDDYSIDVNAVFGQGDYALYWEVAGADAVTPNGRAVTINDPKYCAYRGSTKLTGKVYADNTTMTAAPAGTEVWLWARTYGSTTWSRIATTSVDGAGVYSFTIAPRYLTYYGVGASTFSFQRSVNQKAALSTPSAPTKVVRNRYFTSTGTFKPRPNAGVAYVKAYKWSTKSKKWVLQKSYKAKVTKISSTTSKYSARVRATSAGKWRFVSYVPASRFTYTTYSAGRDRTVK